MDLENPKIEIWIEIKLKELKIQLCCLYRSFPINFYHRNSKFNRNGNLTIRNMLF